MNTFTPTKGPELDQIAKRYILDSVCLDYFTGEETNKAKAEYLRENFEATHQWRVDRIGPQAAVKEWLQGLPSVLHIAFYNHDILELAKEWRTLPENPTEKEEDKILDRYWQFMAAKTLQLMNGSRIPN